MSSHGVGSLAFIVFDPIKLYGCPSSFHCQRDHLARRVAMFGEVSEVGGDAGVSGLVHPGLPPLWACQEVAPDLLSNASRSGILCAG